ncbi:Katanin p80 WD40 repeat-containing subunit B1 [Nymphon striatum]|nr:Katanin p80 WD40 repeat-containing subunit B1 [Nymphon striatum]
MLINAPIPRLESLTGHTSPIESVIFGHSEDVVCAGSMSGALKIWDLEAAKIVRTLTGHKANVRCLDFHLQGEFVVSGSLDSNIKLWDIRRKGCIFTYKGHTKAVNSTKFSPDGRWIASAGEDGVLKLWDIPARKMLAEFSNHAGPVTDVEFHPNEFLLSSASTDRTVKFWDLESFQLVSTTAADSGSIRCIYFNPDGECLFSGSQDLLKVYSWEPGRTRDTLVMGWGKVADIATAQNQLIAASHSHTNASIYVVDLSRVQPLMGQGSRQNSQFVSSGTHHMRKSFVRDRSLSDAEKNSQLESVEPSEVGEEIKTYADLIEPNDYGRIFQPRGKELSRSPPDGDSFPTPERDNNVIPVRHSNINTLSIFRPAPPEWNTPKQNGTELPSQIAKTKAPVSNQPIHKVYTSKAIPIPVQQKIDRSKNILKSQSEVTDMKQNPLVSLPPTAITEPFSQQYQSVRNVTVEIHQKQVQESQKIQQSQIPVPTEDVSKPDKIEYVPTQREKPAGLDVEDFLPKQMQESLRIGMQQQPEMSEAEAISSIVRGHDSMIAVLMNRHKNLQIVRALWTNKDMKTAVDSAINMNDAAITVDILNIAVLRPAMWSLDLCQLILPFIFNLVQSKYESYMNVGCESLKIVLKNFGSVIKSTINAPPSIGVDLQREERYNKCKACYNLLLSIKTFILKRQTMQGKLGQTFRELHNLMQSLD